MTVITPPAFTGKWNLENTNALLTEIEAQAKKDSVIFFSKLLKDLNVSRGVWSHLKKKWKDDEDMMDRIYLIDQCFENKLVSGGLLGTLDERSVMRILRQKYGY